MRCAMPDCAEKFSGIKSKKEYSIFILRSTDFFDKEFRRNRVKLCRKCSYRPVRELIEAILNRPLTETELRAFQEDNTMADFDKGIVEQL